MPSTVPEMSTPTCKHQDYRASCYSCKAASAKEILKQDAITRASLENEIKGIECRLEDENLSPAVKKSLGAELQAKTQRLISLRELEQATLEMISSFEAEIKKLCEGVNANDYAQVIENDAAARNQEMEKVWNIQTSRPRMQFVKEDPDFRADFEGLDCSNIPATLDAMISKGRSGFGLQGLLRVGNKTEWKPEWKPDEALGFKASPAIMPLGRAIRLFDPPEPPYSLPRTTNSIDESSAEKSTETYYTKDRAKTEHEFRLEVEPPTKPNLTREQQWDLFKPEKLERDIPKLIDEYQELAVKDAISNTKDLYREAKPGMALDWNGFTNWVEDCRKSEKSIIKTMQAWDKQRKETRQSIEKALEEYKGSTTWTNEKLGFEPVAELLGNETLLEMHMREAGI